VLCAGLGVLGVLGELRATVVGTAACCRVGGVVGRTLGAHRHGAHRHGAYRHDSERHAPARDHVRVSPAGAGGWAGAGRVHAVLGDVRQH